MEKEICDRCDKEYDVKDRYYQDENTNSQKDGQENSRPQCKEDCNLI